MSEVLKIRIKINKKNRLAYELLEKANILVKKNDYISFWSYIATRMYIKIMFESERYTYKDMKSYNLEKDLNSKEFPICIFDTLLEFYSLYENNKKEEDIIKLIEKYQTWHPVLLQRMYKKYVNHDFIINKKQNSYPEIFII